MKQNEKKYTANIHNTGALIKESKKVISLYSEYKDIPKVKEILLQNNPLHKESEGTIKKILFITKKRYLSNNPLPLANLIESKASLETKKAVMFYYLAKSDHLVYDITIKLLYKLYQEGRINVRKNDVEKFLTKQEEKHPEIEDWSITTRNKTIRHYLATVKDFDLLEGSNMKSFKGYRIPSDAFFYILYYKFYNEDKNSKEIIEDDDWKLYLLSLEEVKAILNEGNRRGYIKYEEAGDIISIKKEFNSLGGLVDEITK